MMDDMIYIMKKQNEEVNTEILHGSLRRCVIGMSNKGH